MDIVVLELHEKIFVELDIGDDAVHGAVRLPCGLIAVGIVFGVELQPVSAWHTDHSIPSVGLACEESFSVEYAAIALLSAVATAIGNTHHIRIKGAWTSSPCLYIILVGHPGQGKTPPLDFAYKPILDYDYSLFCKFKEYYEHYTARQSEKGKDDTLDAAAKPVLLQTILSDFTPEAMMKQHNDNQRGIVILVDEIMGMFNSVNRYNDNPLITQLLTAYSGKQLKVSRCNNPIPAIIRNPCISIIGTTQTQRIAEFFTRENVSSGLVDRFLFVFPKEQRPQIWASANDSIGIPTVTKPSTALRWKEIIDKLLQQECPMAVYHCCYRYQESAFQVIKICLSVITSIIESASSSSST